MGIFATIKEGLADLFPALGDMEVNEDTLLEEIPEWDSMASVNLLMFLQQTFNVELDSDFLHGELKIGEIAAQVGG